MINGVSFVFFLEAFARRKKIFFWFVGFLLVVFVFILIIGFVVIIRTENVIAGGYYLGIIVSFVFSGFAG